MRSRVRRSISFSETIYSDVIRSPWETRTDAFRDSFILSHFQDMHACVIPRDLSDSNVVSSLSLSLSLIAILHFQFRGEISLELLLRFGWQFELEKNVFFWAARMQYNRLSSLLVRVSDRKTEASPSPHLLPLLAYISPKPKEKEMEEGGRGEEKNLGKLSPQIEFGIGYFDVSAMPLMYM